MPHKNTHFCHKNVICWENWGRGESEQKLSDFLIIMVIFLAWGCIPWGLGRHSLKFQSFCPKIGGFLGVLGAVFKIRGFSGIRGF